MTSGGSLGRILRAWGATDCLERVILLEARGEAEVGGRRRRRKQRRQPAARQAATAPAQPCAQPGKGKGKDGKGKGKGKAGAFAALVASSSDEEGFSEVRNEVPPLTPLKATACSGSLSLMGVLDMRVMALQVKEKVAKAKAGSARLRAKEAAAAKAVAMLKAKEAEAAKAVVTAEAARDKLAKP